MGRLVCSKVEKAGGPRLRLLNRSERPFESISGDVPVVSHRMTLEESDKKARLLVAGIAGVGAALAIGFLAAELFGNA